MSEADNQGPWWGGYELELGEAACWAIGPLRLWLHRGEAEWRLGHDWDDDESFDGWRLEQPATLPAEEIDTERFAVSETGSAVELRSLPADRSVVARPKTPFRVQPGQSARIFISSPLWVEIGTGGAEPLVLREVVTRRMSDTWFGATTRDGELSYALKTSARTNLEELPRVAYRLVTPVVIDNHAPDALVVERLSLPVPFLSIYGTPEGDAWSEEVHMLRTEDGGMARLDLLPGPPAEAEGADRVSEPRQVAAKGHLFRAFGSLLGLDL